MSFARATVVGGGLAGLSAVTALAEAGVAVALAEGAAQLGGRCRSYRDPALDLVIDNGNHLVLSGNGAVARFRARIGAPAGTLGGPAHATFAFKDLRDGAAWAVRINDGPLPWWTLAPSRRVPGSRLRDYLPLATLLRARGGRIDAHVVPHGPVWERLLAPVLLAALNTAPEDGAAALARALLRETVAKGGRAMRPLVATPSLDAAFIAPALAWLEQARVPLATGRRLRAIGFDGDRVAALDWGQGQGQGPEPVAGDEAVVLAVPPWIAGTLVPGLVVPDEHRAIVNAHFAIAPPPGAPPLLGLLGADAEWLFAFPDRISVTVSAADRLIDADRETLARTFWSEIEQAYGFAAPLPPWQIVKEKRATFAATPGQDAKRPPARTRWRNLFLAGDWTRTGLPATIEGALRSGEIAARLVLA